MEREEREAFSTHHVESCMHFDVEASFLLPNRVARALSVYLVWSCEHRDVDEFPSKERHSSGVYANE